MLWGGDWRQSLYAAFWRDPSRPREQMAFWQAVTFQTMGLWR